MLLDTGLVEEAQWPGRHDDCVGFVCAGVESDQSDLGCCYSQLRSMSAGSEQLR